jgi:hypothetical protein
MKNSLFIDWRYGLACRQEKKKVGRGVVLVSDRVGVFEKTVQRVGPW